MSGILQTIPGAEPFFFPGNEREEESTGCLLIHSFTGAPKEMGGMGEYLNHRGTSVLGIRLAGHATRPEDLTRTTWQDWLLSVEEGYNLLRHSTRRIFLAGLSMGGNLALVFASRFPVAGVIGMSTPYPRRGNRWLKYLKLLSNLVPYAPKARGNSGEGGWIGDGWKEHLAYPQYPIHAVGEFSLLLDEMRKSLRQVKAPVLLIGSRGDYRFVRESMEKILAGLTRAEKQMVWIEGSGHTLTEEPRREYVFKTAVDFMARVSRVGL